MKWNDRNCDFKKLTEEKCRAQLDAQWEAKMKARSTWIAVAIGLVMALGTAGVAGADAKYVGASKCKTCHKKELIGNQYGAWEKSGHAKAFETLKGEKAIAVAKEKGIAGPPSEAAECLKCHATAAGLGAGDVLLGAREVRFGLLQVLLEVPSVESRDQIALGEQCAFAGDPGEDQPEGKVGVRNDQLMTGEVLDCLRHDQCAGSGVQGGIKVALVLDERELVRTCVIEHRDRSANELIVSDDLATTDEVTNACQSHLQFGHWRNNSLRLW